MYSLYGTGGNTGAPTNLSSFLLELLNGTLVDSTALVDEMASGGGFAGVYVTDDHDVDVLLILSHDWVVLMAFSDEESDNCNRAE